MSDEIEALIQAEKWKEARRLIKKSLRSEPQSHWLMTRLGLTYYEEHEYKTALAYEEAAMKLAPQCPLVLWDYAGTLDMLGREKEAIAIYRKIIKRGLQSLAFDDCGEGIARARGLLADCLYRMAKCYLSIGKPLQAVNYFQQHLSQRGPGCQSIYPIANVRKELKALLVKQSAR
jgi:tetratricopeptide (TPR) repeat protein